jgi:hypothetical protein
VWRPAVTIDHDSLPRHRHASLLVETYLFYTCFNGVL